MSKKKNLLMVALLACLSLSLQAQSFEIASVGNFISEQTANDWTTKFKHKFPTATASYVVDKTLLTIMLSNPDAQGIYFYNALNDDGSTTVIPIACDGTRALIGNLSPAIENFQTKFPSRAYAQLVGRKMIQSLLDIQAGTALLVTNAIDDNGQEKIIYVALDENSQWLSTPGDQTMPCPPYCPKPDPKNFTIVSSVNP